MCDCTKQTSFRPSATKRLWPTRDSLCCHMGSYGVCGVKRETCHPERCEPLSCVSFVSLCIDHLGFQFRLSHELYMIYMLLLIQGPIQTKLPPYFLVISYPAPSDCYLTTEQHVKDGFGSQWSWTAIIDKARKMLRSVRGVFLGMFGQETNSPPTLITGVGH